MKRSDRQERTRGEETSPYGDVDSEGDIVVDVRLLVAETEAWLVRIGG